MKKILFALALLTGGAVFGADFSIGIRIGPPPAPRVVRFRPQAPGPGFIWIEGYWYAAGNRYRWHDGYWTRPPYEGAIWMGPRYEGQSFYDGYWQGGGRQVGHDHRWDRNKERDYRGRDRDDHGRDHDHD